MLANFFSNDIAYAIAMTLVHSIWQISILAILLGVLLKVTKQASNTTRYLFALSALGFSILLSLVTFSLYMIESQSGAVDLGYVFISANAASQNISASWMPMTTDFISKYFYVIVNAWIIGSLLFFIKFSGSYLYLKYLINRSDIENGRLNKSLKKLNKKFKIHRTIIVKESLRINSPLVMGYLKPVILFPVGLINQLSVSEVDSILAHELAHIKRHDYLFKLIQSFAEIIFYYHPGIWYISSQISFSRELCCDDMAIEYTGNSFSYAKTLVKLQEMKSNHLNPALSFSGNKNLFSQRILRLLDVPFKPNNTKQKILAFLLVFSTVFVFAKSADDKINEENPTDVYIIDDCPQDLEEINFYLDTIPEKNSFHIKKHTEEKELELKMENGNITHLKIDGDEIDEEDYDKYENIIIELKPEKGKDVITVFPDCDKDLGNIFYLDKLRDEVINLDSVVKRFNGANLFYSDDELAELEMVFKDYDRDWVDSLKENIESKIIIQGMPGATFKIDSVFDVFKDHIKVFPDILDDEEYTVHTLKELRDGSKALAELYSNKDYSRTIELLKEKEKLLKDKMLFFEDDLKDKYFNVLPEDDIFFFENRSENVSDVITRHLLKDQLVENNEKVKVELSGKHMKINGEKQPSNIWKKYKNIYQEKTGIELSKKSKLEFEITPKSKRESYIRKLI